MYKPLSTDMNYPQREEEVLELWRELDLKALLRKQNLERPAFTVYEGPPTTNGHPHIGHVLTRTIKDIIPRYKTMRGYNAYFKAGWDTHGLPVELEVEKMLGINGKPEIEAYGVQPFIEQCKKSVWRYLDEWERLSERVAYQADMENPYITYENEYIESIWWSLAEIDRKGLLYKGNKILPYCPRCGTTLSSHEVAQGYKDITDTSIYVRFPVLGEENTYFAAWTTTPWTLPSNVALCVNPHAKYVLIELRQEGRTARYYLAEGLVEETFGEEVDYEIIAVFRGTELVGKRYEPLFDYARSMLGDQAESTWRVVSDDYVTLSEGSGIVHTAPAFGEDDNRVGRRENLPFVQLVETDGTMSPAAVDVVGVFCRDADPILIGILEKKGLLIRALPITHSYPFCWRCHTALIYYARESWFVEMTAVRDALLRNNRTVNWIPANIRDGRFGNFLENVVDWSISRDRYWGTPIPVWECSCGAHKVIGSVAELRENSPDCPDDIELHKPWIDAVHVKCEACGELMQRVSSVLDCWYDSGAMPFAQQHYPFENESTFLQSYPADFISEALDQTRGWFYSLIALGTALFDQSPYRNVMVMGLILDKEGVKMSKHKGNVVDPWDIIDKSGADALRWYFYTATQPYLTSRFSEDAVMEGRSRYMDTLRNACVFYRLYAEIDRFDPSKYSRDDLQPTLMDKWLLSEIDNLSETIATRLDKYEITAAGRLLENFVIDLSNWYIRRGRERYWGSGLSRDKITAYLTLYTVLERLIRLTAPFTPFIAEELYQALVVPVLPEAPPSVHLTAYPRAGRANDLLNCTPEEMTREGAQNLEQIDRELSENMRLVREIVALGRAGRNNSGLKIRQPLSELYIHGLDAALDEEYETLICDELNVDTIIYPESSEALVYYSLKPQLKNLGPRLGKHLPAFRVRLNELSAKEQTEIARSLLRGETVSFFGNQSDVPDGFTEEDFIIETTEPEGLAVTRDQGLTVALNTALTEELVQRGFARELISKIQTTRRENGFEIADRIDITAYCGDVLESVFRAHGEMISKATLALSITTFPLSAVPADASVADLQTWDVNGEECLLKLERRA